MYKDHDSARTAQTVPPKSCSGFLVVGIKRTFVEAYYRLLFVGFKPILMVISNAMQSNSFLLAV